MISLSGNFYCNIFLLHRAIYYSRRCGGVRREENVGKMDYGNQMIYWKFNICLEFKFFNVIELL
jgi:hypothetical protein